MDIFQLLLLGLVGLVAGFVNILAGGGSLLTIPVMVFMGMPGAVANGTNRIAIISQNIFAVGGFFRKGFSDFKLSLSLAICALPGTIVGAYLGTKLQGLWFNRVLAGVMVMVMIVMTVGSKTGKKSAQKNISAKTIPFSRLVGAHVLMVGAGFYGGFIQAGVGFILMSILHKVLGLDLVRVNMHKVFIVGVYLVPALIIFAWQGKVWWVAGAALAVGNSLGGWLGVNFAVKKGERAIKLFLYVALTVLAVKLMFFS